MGWWVGGLVSWWVGGLRGVGLVIAWWVWWVVWWVGCLVIGVTSVFDRGYTKEDDRGYKILD